MGLALKMFDTLGIVTLVTAPSMILPDKISFTLINLEEKEKNEFAKAINKVFPQDNIVVFIYNETGNEAWLETAISRSRYVLMDSDKSPIWVNEMAPENKTYFISQQQSVQQVFETISKKIKN
jgi:hypothetical protein|tara:strand:- start:1221 stop:1589 length:369 start_codon:yes stop_codon:yes gene_type:complete